jgi:hypothetical protein
MDPDLTQLLRDFAPIMAALLIGAAMGFAAGRSRRQQAVKEATNKAWRMAETIYVRRGQH